MKIWIYLGNSLVSHIRQGVEAGAHLTLKKNNIQPGKQHVIQKLLST